ncbi:NAD-dependent epimerase/dehydratase family protein [Enterococcus sp. DIV1314a]|uniref:NAD-dependent epimerase/dehydratase family protein n=1 Tax=Enterococcus sp. DIV1314a TaxID=2774660 RepID=UPI003F1EC8D4
MKRVLITGANSYIGSHVEEWLKKNPDAYSVDTIDMIDGKWKVKDFSQYDVIYHVAGIAHADVGNVSEERKLLYYKINTDLAVEVAQKAKNEGVKQFIFMSSMIVYSGCEEKFITKDTAPVALNFYGDSKWQADQKIRAIETRDFKVVVLRPPMIYGNKSKGNYAELVKLATKLPVFPVVINRRSMLYIDNLCEFVKLMIDNQESGVFFPQNSQYTVTSEMVHMIAKTKGHKIVMIPGFGWIIKLLMKFPGKIGGLATKAFGDSAYDLKMSEYKINYRVVGFEESILKEGRIDEYET